MRADGYNLDIINPQDAGDLYYITIWCGQGGVLDEYYVYARDYEQAIDLVFDYSYENGDGNVFGYEQTQEWCVDDYNNKNYYGDGVAPKDAWNGDFEGFADEWYEDFESNTGMSLFAFKDNFSITEVTPEMLED